MAVEHQSVNAATLSVPLSLGDYRVLVEVADGDDADAGYMLFDGANDHSKSAVTAPTQWDGSQWVSGSGTLASHRWVFEVSATQMLNLDAFDDSIVSVTVARVSQTGTGNFVLDYRGGRLVEDSRFVYEWDGFNRITRAEAKIKSDTEEYPDYVEYLYDGLGRRVKATFEGGRVLDYLYDGINIVGIKDSAGPDKYFYYEGVNRLFAMKIVDGGSETWYACITDDRGTLMGIADADGNVIEKLYYNSTGLCQTDSGHKMSQYAPFGWTGLYLDDYTGKYHAHYRDYSPIHARWLSEDPAGYVDGLNLYAAYMGVNGRDPSGLWNLFFPGTWGVPNGGDADFFDSINPFSTKTNGWDGYVEGFVGGATIVADTMTFNSIDSLNKKANSYQGAAYDFSRASSAFGREMLIGAGTAGSANMVQAGRGGVAMLRTAQTLQVIEAGRSGYSVGTGINKVANGDNWGYLDIALGGVQGFSAFGAAKTMKYCPRVQANVIDTSELLSELKNGSQFSRNLAGVLENQTHKIFILDDVAFDVIAQKAGYNSGTAVNALVEPTGMIALKATRGTRMASDLVHEGSHLLFKRKSFLSNYSNDLLDEFSAFRNQIDFLKCKKLIDPGIPERVMTGGSDDLIRAIISNYEKFQ